MLDSVFAVERHNLIPHGLGDRVQRNRQVHPNLFACARHHRHDAGSRKGNPPPRQSESIAVHDDLQRVAHIVEIVERLAHAHHHDIGEHPPLGLGRPFAQRVAGEHHLADDLCRLEIAHQLHRPGRAEAAVERAADLARHTQRAAVGVGNEHHLEIMAVVRPQQPLARAVRRHLRLNNFGTRDDKALGEPAALGLGDVGHGGEVADAAIVDPVPDLLGPKLRLARVQPGSQELGADLILRQADELNPPVGARADAARNGYGIDRARNGHQGRVGTHGEAFI